MIKILVESPLTPESRRALSEMVLVSEDRVLEGRNKLPLSGSPLLNPVLPSLWDKLPHQFLPGKTSSHKTLKYWVSLKAEFSKNFERQV